MTPLRFRGTKLRISEQSAKRKAKIFIFARSSESNFGRAKVTNKRAECKKNLVLFSCAPRQRRGHRV